MQRLVKLKKVLKASDLTSLAENFRAIKAAGGKFRNLTAEEVGIITSLYGINNIWADTGDVLSITYPADTKLFIDQNNAEQDAEIAGTKGIIGDSMDGTASRLIENGEYFIMGGTLYKATVNIANGETITPNTNCTATSVSEALADIWGSIATGVSF